MKRKRYTEDLEFKISDEEADDADAAGGDSPSNTSQSEQQVGSREWVGRKLSTWSLSCQRRGRSGTPSGGRVCSCGLMCRGKFLVRECLKNPCSLKFVFMQGYDMQFDTILEN